MKRDKQFEDWYWNEFGQFEDDGWLECFRIEEGDYYRLGTRMSYSAWQASWQAIEIALPVLGQQGEVVYQLWSPGIGQWVECDKQRYDEWNHFPAQRRLLYTVPQQPEPYTTPQIDNDGWIEWKGGECPLGDNCLVKIRLRDTMENEGFAGDFTWRHGDYFQDIIAYRVIENDGREG